jgi:AcrR family transcriptional regulator
MRKKPVGLTHEKIRRAALELIDADGLEAFSTRKLGAALGCEAMAIYWYYPSKDALLDAVVEELMSRVGRVAPGAVDWVPALRDVARAYRGLAHEHPNAFPLVATRRFATEGTFGFLEKLFELAHRQGIDDRTSARFFRAVSAYCNGIALNEIATRRQREERPSGDDLERFTAVSKWLAPKHEDDLFEFGLAVLLDALATRTPRSRRPARGARAAAHGT